MSASVAKVPVREMAPRIQQLADRATCIQKVSVGEMAAAFVKYVDANPSTAGRSYREPLIRTITTTYCKK